MTTIGADVEGLRALAGDFTRGAAELSQLSAELARAIDAADDWQGPDATRAKGEWGELARARMTSVAEALAAAGQLLDTEAREQEHGSAAGADATAGVGVPPPSTAGRSGSGFWAGVSAWAGGLWKLKGVVGKATGLARFFGAMAKESFFARTRNAARAIESLLGHVRAGTTIESMLAKIPLVGKYAAGLATLVPVAALEKWMPLISRASRFMPLVSAVLAIPDLRDGGGYAGLRGGITRALAGGAIVGGLTLAGGAWLLGGTAALVVAAPAVAAVAGGAGLLYGAWGLANHAYDHSALVRGVVDGAGARIGDAVDSARSWARGLLGLSPAAAGAGS